MLEWSDRIEALRKNLDLTQRQLAKLLGISPNYVHLWETRGRGVNTCWERVIQFIEDCPSEALGILDELSVENEGRWSERIQALLEKLGWTHEELSEFIGVWPHTLYAYKRGRNLPPCSKLIVSLLEIYSDIPVQSWPPALYSKPPDVISAERVKLLRRALNMTQYQLADILHVTKTTISNYEDGGGSPGWCGNLLLRILETFPTAAPLLSRIPRTLTEERISAEMARSIRENIGLTTLQFSHLLGITWDSIENRLEREGIYGGCAALVYLLIEKYPNEFIPLVQGLLGPGGQACPT